MKRKQMTREQQRDQLTGMAISLIGCLVIAAHGGLMLLLGVFLFVWGNNLTRDK